MTKGIFYYADWDGNYQKLVNPTASNDYNIDIGSGDILNLTDATASLYAQHGRGGRVESIQPGDLKRSNHVYLCCRFAT